MVTHTEITSAIKQLNNVKATEMLNAISKENHINKEMSFKLQSVIFVDFKQVFDILNVKQCGVNILWHSISALALCSAIAIYGCGTLEDISTKKA